MNVTTTSNNQLPGAAASSEPAVAGAAPVATFDPLLASAPAPAQDAAAPFAQWLAQALPELLSEAAPVDAAGGETDAATDTPTDTPADGADTAQAQPAAPDVALLAAMAAPLMAPGAPPLPTSAPGAAPTPAPAAAPALAGIAGAQPAGGDLFAALTRTSAPAQRGAAGGQAEAAAVPAAAAQDPQGIDATAPAPAAMAAATADAPAPGTAGATAQARPASAAADGASQDKPASAATSVMAAPAAAAPAPANSASAPVALAGPPAAWRQTLHNALGERLQLQVGGNIEQAVIRLEPPNLGRIDIAIRHSAGALEVSLSATNSEVVRQLHAVTDNLRNDLSSRQYSEVSVTVAQAAPRAQAGASNPFADQQGRQRQSSREQQEAEPGMALADNNNPNTSFSLNGRE